MHGSQIIIVGIVSIIVYKTLVSYFSKKITLLFALCWLSFWLTVLTAVCFPKWMDIVASFVGVGRGVDFAVYLSVVVLFFMIYRIYTHLMRIEDKMTKIVREETISKKSRNE